MKKKIESGTAPRFFLFEKDKKQRVLLNREKPEKKPEKPRPVETYVRRT
jgi:hypothetical protein